MLGCINNAREVRCNQRQEGKGNQQRKHEVLQGVAGSESAPGAALPPRPSSLPSAGRPGEKADGGSVGREELRDALHFFASHLKKIPLLKSSSGRDFRARQRDSEPPGCLTSGKPLPFPQPVVSVYKMVIKIVFSPRAGSERSPHKHKKLFRPLTSPSPTPTDDIGAGAAEEMITLVVARWAQGRQRALNNSECQK